MPIHIECARCNSHFRPPDSAGGKTGTCPKCGSKISIPAAEHDDLSSETFIGPFTPIIAEPRRNGDRRPSTMPAQWLFGTLLALILGGVVLFLVSDRPPHSQSTPTQAPPSPDLVEALPPTKPIPAERLPFAFRVTSEEWRDAINRRHVTVEAMVDEDVAPKVKQADLESLVPYFIEKYEGASFKVLFETKTPLSNPWGIISYNTNFEPPQISCKILKYAFEDGPWYFPEHIDPNTEWHGRVWLTLPKVNKIVNGAAEYYWKVTYRSANDVHFESAHHPRGTIRDTMTLSPQTWEISTYDGDVPRFVRLVETTVNHLDLEMSKTIIERLNSVIGSQEYLRGDKRFWTWMLGSLELTFYHDTGSDRITIMQTERQKKNMDGQDEQDVRREED